ncbi:MAG: P-type DNA transfer ATPase VirB11 [Litorimonas sp.]
MALRSGHYLTRYLEPLRPWLDAPGISEISVNRPQKVWIEAAGKPREEFDVPDLTSELLAQLSRQIAASADQLINEERPLLSAALPTGERVQVVAPPAAPNGYALSIRKQVLHSMNLDDYAKQGAFDMTTLTREIAVSDEVKALQVALKNGDVQKFLTLAVRSHQNMVISGGTSTGKTTFLNALLQEIPMDERIITIEDTREVNAPHGNLLNLIAAKGDQGKSLVTIQDLLEATLRLRPDRIILGELRGKEAYTFLRAINTGHPGSICTLHADSPAGAIEQLSLMVLQANLGLSRDEIKDYVSSMIDIVIQLKREGSRRYISAIQFKHA